MAPHCRWYRTLDRAFPARTLANFAAKVRKSGRLPLCRCGTSTHPHPGCSCLFAYPQVSLNQLCLAPLTITMAFGINLALQQRLGELPGKLQADFVPTMLNGWRFWVPAASVNFTLVPLRYQVLYMSCCGELQAAPPSVVEPEPEAGTLACPNPTAPHLTPATCYLQAACGRPTSPTAAPKRRARDQLFLQVCWVVEESAAPHRSVRLNGPAKEMILLAAHCQNNVLHHLSCAPFLVAAFPAAYHAGHVTPSLPLVRGAAAASGCYVRFQPPACLLAGPRVSWRG